MKDNLIQTIFANLEGYNNIEYIGKGSFGKVYKALSEARNEIVALKIIGKRHDRDVYFEELIKRERESLQILQGQPNIVQLYDYFEDEKQYIFVFEFCHFDLEQLLMEVFRDFRLPLKSVQHISIEILNALNAIHQKGFIHRDLKLDNILIRLEPGDYEFLNAQTQNFAHKFQCLPSIIKRSKIKLTDFGLAQQVNFANTQVGSPYTMAPEILLKERYGQPVDMYGLGVLVYRLIYYRYTFTLTEHTYDLRNIFETLKRNQINFDCKYRNQEMTPDLIDLLSKMLELDQNKRITFEDLKKNPWFTPIRTLSHQTETLISSSEQIKIETPSHLKTPPQQTQKKKIIQIISESDSSEEPQIIINEQTPQTVNQPNFECQDPDDKLIANQPKKETTNPYQNYQDQQFQDKAIKRGLDEQQSSSDKKQLIAQKQLHQIQQKSNVQEFKQTFNQLNTVQQKNEQQKEANIEAKKEFLQDSPQKEIPIKKPLIEEKVLSQTQLLDVEDLTKYLYKGRNHNFVFQQVFLMLVRLKATEFNPITIPIGCFALYNQNDQEENIQKQLNDLKRFTNAKQYLTKIEELQLQMQQDNKEFTFLYKENISEYQQNSFFENFLCQGWDKINIQILNRLSEMRKDIKNQNILREIEISICQLERVQDKLREDMTLLHLDKKLDIYLEKQRVPTRTREDNRALTNEVYLDNDQQGQKEYQQFQEVEKAIQQLYKHRNYSYLLLQLYDVFFQLEGIKIQVQRQKVELQDHCKWHYQRLKSDGIQLEQKINYNKRASCYKEAITKILNAFDSDIDEFRIPTNFRTYLNIQYGIQTKVYQDVLNEIRKTKSGDKSLIQLVQKGLLIIDYAEYNRESNTLKLELETQINQNLIQIDFKGDTQQQKQISPFNQNPSLKDDHFEKQLLEMYKQRNLIYLLMQLKDQWTQFKYEHTVEAYPEIDNKIYYLSNIIFDKHSKLSQRIGYYIQEEQTHGLRLVKAKQLQEQMAKDLQEYGIKKINKEIRNLEILDRQFDQQFRILALLYNGKKYQISQKINQIMEKLIKKQAYAYELIDKFN